MAVEVSRLERRVQVLRQARKYQVEDEEGGRNGEVELRRVCDEWKEYGR